MKPYLLLACCLSAFSSVAATPSGELQQKLDTLSGFKADFKQTVTDVNQQVIQSGTGILALAQPNHFYWHLKQPDESLIVADGKDVWIYNPFAEEVSVVTMDDAISASPMTLLVHRSDAAWSKYTITQEGGCYHILPKAEEAGVQRVSVCFSHQTLNTISLDDNQGNHSEFSLSDVSSLTADDDSLFHFRVPDGVYVDDQRNKQ